MEGGSCQSTGGDWGGGGEKADVEGRRRKYGKEEKGRKEQKQRTRHVSSSSVQIQDLVAGPSRAP